MLSKPSPSDAQTVTIFDQRPVRLSLVVCLAVLTLFLAGPGWDGSALSFLMSTSLFRQAGVEIQVELVKVSMVLVFLARLIHFGVFAVGLAVLVAGIWGEVSSPGPTGRLDHQDDLKQENDLRQENDELRRENEKAREMVGRMKQVINEMSLAGRKMEQQTKKAEQQHKRTVEKCDRYRAERDEARMWCDGLAAQFGVGQAQATAAATETATAPATAPAPHNSPFFVGSALFIACGAVVFMLLQ